MKIFEEPNFIKNGKSCPVCGTQDNKPVVLVKLTNTAEANKYQAVQVHVECLDLLYCSDHGIMFQYVRYNK